MYFLERESNSDVSKARESLWVVIPSGYRTKYLRSVVSEIGVEKSFILFVRNYPGKPVRGVNYIFDYGDVNIQRWWNIGIDWVASKGGRFVAILSDDIRIKPGQLEIMFNEIRENKLAIVASKDSNGGFWGHAFILDIFSGVRPDERFNWAYGDNDLRRQAKSKGGFKHSSQEIFHIEINLQTSRSEELSKLSRADRDKYFEKYPVERLKSKLSRLYLVYRKLFPARHKYHL